MEQAAKQFRFSLGSVSKIIVAAPADSREDLECTIRSAFGLAPQVSFTVEDDSGRIFVIGPNLPAGEYQIKLPATVDLRNGGLVPKINIAAEIAKIEAERPTFTDHTELNRMLDSEMYNGFDEELVYLRNRSNQLLYLYNTYGSFLSPEDRRLLLEHITEKPVPAGLCIEPPLACDYGSFIDFGENVFINFNCVILDVCKVTIGSNTLIGPNVSIFAAEHPVEAHERIKGLESGRPVKIGENVWIGGGAMIMPGVTIGDNTVIGAGAVVTKNIPDNVVAAGVPARVIKVLPPPPQQQATGST